MIQLYNTLTRKKQNFEPFDRKKVGIYSCGPTVYNFAHIGNLRAFMFADLLKRALLHKGYAVEHIMNITDVGHLTGDRDMGDDKIQEGAKKENKTAWEIASYYTEAFLKDIKELNILFADKYPKATDHIKQMIDLILILEDKNFTYKTSDGIYFDTSKFTDYGLLAHLDIKGLEEGARVEKNPEKLHPTDFALWKFSKPREKRQMEWQSPWGVGFPGWHIECSAMSRHYLGQPFDIHTGGIDHIPVHHTNEIAQSKCAYGKDLAKYWLHSEFVTIDDNRMGKSKGNPITLDELKEKGYSPLAYRYFVLQGHYRTKLNFTWQAMDSAQNSLDNLYASIISAKGPDIGCSEFESRFYQHINDDLDTPKALAVMWEMLRSDYPAEAKYRSLVEMDKVLGLCVDQVWEENKNLPESIRKKIDQREKYREQEEYEQADLIRNELVSRGYEIRDTKSGTIIRKKL